jgi:hypothetical protein
MFSASCRLRRGTLKVTVFRTAAFTGLCAGKAAFCLCAARAAVIRLRLGEGYKQHCGNAVRLLPPQPFYFTEDLRMDKITGDSGNEITWFSDLLKETEVFLNERGATISPDEVHIVFDPSTLWSGITRKKAQVTISHLRRKGGGRMNILAVDGKPVPDGANVRLDKDMARQEIETERIGWKTLRALERIKFSASGILEYIPKNTVLYKSVGGVLKSVDAARLEAARKIEAEAPGHDRDLMEFFYWAVKESNNVS